VSADTPPDWYPDPADATQERWWTGQEWTADVRPSRAAAAATTSASRPPRAAVVAAAVLGGLTLLVVGAVVTLTGGEPDRAIDDLAATAPEDEPAASEDEAEDPADGDAEQDGDAEPDGAQDDEAEGGEADSADADGDGAAEDVDVGDEPSDEAGDDADERDAEPIDLDGACTVDPDDVPDTDGDLRAWDVPACRWAPVDLGDGSRWIVVVASLDGTANEGEDAESRAARLGDDGGVLWSSHYPSLNPGWWVVFEGPFPDEDAANDAAAARGGGSYPRLLSDDRGDRYCIAAGGCRPTGSDS
jgi:hypothetical protein